MSAAIWLATVWFDTAPVVQPGDQRVREATGAALGDREADLLSEARPPLQNTVAQSDRATSIVVADHEYFDDLLNTLPDAYQQLGRQGLYGDFFSFYLCDLVLKVNG